MAEDNKQPVPEKQPVKRLRTGDEYRAYMREYMRRWRAKKKNEPR